MGRVVAAAAVSRDFRTAVVGMICIILGIVSYFASFGSTCGRAIFSSTSCKEAPYSRLDLFDFLFVFSITVPVQFNPRSVLLNAHTLTLVCTCLFIFLVQVLDIEIFFKK